MEVFQTDHYYIFVQKEKSLWWNRTTSELQIKCGWDLSSVDDIECIGITPGIIGTISYPGLYEPRMVIIKEATPVGVLYPPHLVYKIRSICLLSADKPDTILLPCHRHNTSRAAVATGTNNSGKSSSPVKSRLFESSQLVNKTWGAVKSAGSTIKNTTQQAAAIASSQVRSTVVGQTGGGGAGGSGSVIRDVAKIEKKISEELHKIFDDTDSFYFCLESDITNNLQRRHLTDFDERFFWNMHMLKDVLKLNDKMWILPIVQGFVQVEQCVIGNECFTLALVSRRSRHRAGTRYKRRGVDEQGNVANYVETEQILSFHEHQIAFTQVRGSVPVFWSQPGYKYRPPPRIDRDETETQMAFEKHFAKELAIYRSICIVNLVEQSGKEKVISDAYANHVVKLNSDQLIYVTFDFHEYCRGMRFENVSELIEALAPEAGAMGFHWRDKTGAICNQKSVFRVNCMDCLDRTNVVQTALGKAVLESQLVKLGLAPPYSPLPDQLKMPFMILWANNGDVISKQYAGTNALKGDYTRTGERKFTGIMKDGMNSASRFIIQNFADARRQAVIDLMQGEVSAACPSNNRREELRKLWAVFDDEELMNALVGILTTNFVPSRAPPSARHFNYGLLEPEIRLAETVYDVSSYYLARFKDSYRQATTDLMLGNQISTESLNALGGMVVPDETDTLEGAEHAKLLVEDCRRLLLGSAKCPVGAWGLIDADPLTGDPAETEVDSILLLTDDSYIVAEYDSHLDKIVRFEKVALADITLVEFGVYHQSKMFQTGTTNHLCIRINYTINRSDGYFHMFRSPNLRFFNNVAVVIRTPEEINESLTAIVEFFKIALENRGVRVPFECGNTLQRRKSKTVLLDVPKGMPRNLSESQILQLGTKALSNVAGQFSKLGQTFNRTEPTAAKTPTDSDRPNFSVGPKANKNRHTNKTTAANNDDSSESDENDCSIYEPDTSDLVQENPLYNENTFLPSVGIVMSNTNDSSTSSDHQRGDTKSMKMSSDVSTMSITSVTDHVGMPAGMLDNVSPIKTRNPPEIKIQSSNVEPLGKMNQQQFSHSSGEMNQLVAGDVTDSGSRSSDRNFSLNLSGSQSDNALKSLKSLSSPLTKLAKGMQTIGMNLDPRKIVTKGGGVLTGDTVTSPSGGGPGAGESQRLHDLWVENKCKTKLIAL